MKVLIACEFSGVVREAFKSKGHYAMSCDLEDTEVAGLHYKGNVLDILESENWDLLIAHPPCTYLSVAGNKWFKDEFKERFPNRQNDREEAIKFFLQLANCKIPKKCIENPIGIMSRIYKKPSQIINPFQFGHSFNKKTCLWLKNLPLLLPTNIVEQDEVITFASGKKMSKWWIETGHLPPIERTKARNRTFTGIAEAMANQWS